MGYNRHTNKREELSDMLTPEEMDVRAALKEYRVDSEAMHTWVPVFELYKVYVKYWLSRTTYPGDPEPERLSMAHFSAAMRRVFPVAEPDVIRPQGIEPVLRRVNGRKVKGYARLVGPLSREMGKPGRPRKSRRV